MCELALKLSKKNAIFFIFFYIFSIFSFTASTCGFAADLPISSKFGWRIHPISNEWKFHSGLDLAYDYNTEIPALFDGIVVFAAEKGGYGQMIYLYHPTIDAYTAYAHCSRLLASQGEEIKAGKTIALVGSSGNSTGPHVHIEYLTKDENGTWQYSDPLALWE